MTDFLYLFSSICFILSLRGLSSPPSARAGNLWGMIGMALAVVATLFNPTVISYEWIVAGLLIGGSIGTLIARKIQMTALPQLVAFFHSLVGLAAVFVAACAFYNPYAFGIIKNGTLSISALIEMGLGTVIGSLTFSGSLMAFAKLQGVIKKTFRLPFHKAITAGVAAFTLGAIIHFGYDPCDYAFWTFTLTAFILGIILITPIGGADMPVVVSMLNSYSGWAACGIGFTLQNSLLIITGALVGSSGAILSYIMCKAMNRSIFNVILGGAPSDLTVKNASSPEQICKTGSPDDAAFMMKNSQSVIIVPGYGMAVAQAQHALREMTELLKEAGVHVRFAIHPVAGRMPGHMNVLLAEANIPYEDVLELEDINRDFSSTDVAFVIGANDVTNPAAKTDPQSPIYGMPILDVEKARSVFFIKRSMAAGYAGVENELFYRPNTMMLFGDAKKMVESIIKSLEALS